MAAGAGQVQAVPVTVQADDGDLYALARLDYLSGRIDRDIGQHRLGRTERTADTYAQIEKVLAALGG